MRRGAVIVGVIGAIWLPAFLYIGSTHRDRCIKAGNVGCSILPWSGSARSIGGWWNNDPFRSGYLLPGTSNP